MLMYFTGEKRDPVLVPLGMKDNSYQSMMSVACLQVTHTLQAEHACNKSRVHNTSERKILYQYQK